MKRLFSVLVLMIMITALVPAALADPYSEWYSTYFCYNCNCNRRCICGYGDFCLDYDNSDEYHDFYHTDCAQCQTCGNYIYCNDYSCFENHHYYNGVCTDCGHRRTGSGGGYTEKVFVCSDSVKLRTNAGGGTVMDSAKYGEMFEYRNTVARGNDGDPWFEIRFHNGVQAYVAGGTVNSEWWLLRRTCTIRYYNSPRNLRITDSTHLVKAPDYYSGDNVNKSVYASSGSSFTCYGETFDNVFNGKEWYLVKYSGSWYFVPTSDARLN